MGGLVEPARRPLPGEGGDGGGARAGGTQQGFSSGVALLLVRALAGSKFSGQAARLREGARGVSRPCETARSAAGDPPGALRGEGARRLPSNAKEPAAGPLGGGDLGPRQPEGRDGRALLATARARHRRSRSRLAWHGTIAGKGRSGRGA